MGAGARTKEGFGLDTVLLADGLRRVLESAPHAHHGCYATPNVGCRCGLWALRFELGVWIPDPLVPFSELEPGRARQLEDVCREALAWLEGRLEAGDPLAWEHERARRVADALRRRLGER